MSTLGEPHDTSLDAESEVEVRSDVATYSEADFFDLNLTL